MKRPLTTYLLLALLAFLGIGGTAGGAMLFIKPDGSLLGMDPTWLDGSLFDSYLIPGVVLFTLNGLLPLFALLGLLFRPHWQWANALNIYANRHWAWTYSLYSGIIVITRITVQLVLTRYFWLQSVMIFTGLLIIILTLTPAVMKSMEKSMGTYYHGTKANLKKGDLIAPGFTSNYGQQRQAKYIYLTATQDAAIWGAELAVGEGAGRIYIVEPTGPIEDDPNLTDKKFHGNPTKSYRSLHPLRVVGELTGWVGHSPEQLKAMREGLERLKAQGIEAIEN